MKPGDRVMDGNRIGTVVALRPGSSVDVQFDDVKFVTRRGSASLVPIRRPSRSLTVLKKNPKPKSPVFVAAVLTPEAKRSLYRYWVTQPAAPEPLPILKSSHMTIQFRPSLADISTMPIGQEVQLQVTGWASEKKIQAVSVEPVGVGSANAVPHVTFALADVSVPPKLSNDLFAGAATHSKTSAGPVLTARVGWSDGANYHFEMPEGVQSNPGPRGGLTAVERESLPPSEFALPGRRFPINDANHGRIALQYILAGRVAEGDVNTVVRAVLRRWGNDPTVRAFYQKHKAKLTQENVERIHGRRYAANPAGEVYDPAKEQFRAVVQGVYESLVRKELGKKYDEPFVQNPRGRRLDASLHPDQKRQLLSSAYAIATRQGQKHGWLEPGTQKPTAKGRRRSEERLLDPSQRQHATENREDYERTLASVRKSGHFRVVAEAVNGQTRYVVQPRPPAELITIPEYRMSSTRAQEDADRAAAAFRAAPKALKARTNPYFLLDKGGNESVLADVEDKPKSAKIGSGIQVGRESYRSLAKKLGVDTPTLMRYGTVKFTVPREDDPSKQEVIKLVPHRVSGDRRPYPQETHSIPKAMTGGTIDKADLLKAIRKSDSTLAEYKTRKEREESKAEVDARLQQTARPRAPAFVPDDAVPPQQVALVQMFRGFKAGETLPAGYVATTPQTDDSGKPIAYFGYFVGEGDPLTRLSKPPAPKAPEAPAPAQPPEPESPRRTIKYSPLNTPPQSVVDDVMDRLSPGMVVIVNATPPDHPAGVYYAPSTVPVDLTAVYEFLRRYVVSDNLKKILVFSSPEAARAKFDLSKVPEALRYLYQQAGPALSPESIKSEDARALKLAQKAEAEERMRQQLFRPKAAGKQRLTERELKVRAAARDRAIASLGTPKETEEIAVEIPVEDMQTVRALTKVESTLSSASSRPYALAQYMPPVDTDLLKVTEAEKDKLVRERRVRMEREFEAAQKRPAEPEERRKIQQLALAEVNKELTSIGADPEELTKLAEAIRRQLSVNKAAAIEQLVRPALEPSSVAAKSTKVLKYEPKAPEDPDIKRTYWDVEFRRNADDQIETHYALYTPKRAGFIAREKLTVGRTIVRPETGFVRLKKGGGPGSGQPSGETYLVSKQDLTRLEERKKAATKAKDFIAAAELSNQIAAYRQREQDKSVKIAMGAIDTSKSDQITAATRVALFTLPPEGEEEDIFAEYSEKPKTPTDDHAWIEDLQFTREMRGLRRKALSMKERVADPRSGYMKFTTRNPLLAYYTIMLWHSPEFFTGFSITLPAAVRRAGFKEFDVVNIPPVTDPRNVHHSPFFGYYMALAAEVMMQGALAAAVLRGDAEEAARLYLNLYGKSDVVSAEDRGLRASINKLTALIRPLEQRPSAEKDKDLEEKKQALEEYRALLERGRIGRDELAESKQIAAEMKRQISSAALERARHSFAETELGEILAQATGPSKAEDIVAEAWLALEDTDMWQSVMGAPSTWKYAKVKENRARQRPLRR